MRTHTRSRARAHTNSPWPSALPLYSTPVPVFVWCAAALHGALVVPLVDELLKRKEREVNHARMRERRLVFDTRLGMHSPQ